jgi:hypothetical protein
MPARKKTRSTAQAVPYSGNVPEIRVGAGVIEFDDSEQRLNDLEKMIYETKRLVECVVRFAAKESPTTEDRDAMFELLGRYCN